MKALSLWQPWASAVALGAKRVETRCWSTRYRGPLLIHAAARINKNELIYYDCCWNWCGALDRTIRSDRAPLWEALPFGAIVATCDLVDCRPVESFTLGEIETPRVPDVADRPNTAGSKTGLYNWTERQMGDYSLGRFGWVLEDIRPLSVPIPARGGQRLWNPKPDVIAALREQFESEAGR